MDPFRPSQGYRRLDHEGNQAIEFWAPTEEGVLLVGALAVVEMMTGDPAPEHPGEYDADDERPVSFDASDAADRMVRWLRLVIEAAREGLLVRHADLNLSAAGLTGRIYGDTGAVAAKLDDIGDHDAELTHHDYGCYGRVVFARTTH